MAIRRLDLNEQEKLNTKVYVLCKSNSWGYIRIA